VDEDGGREAVVLAERLGLRDRRERELVRRTVLPFDAEDVAVAVGDEGGGHGTNGEMPSRTANSFLRVITGTM
jgi:hypothetical protein